ncbi:hypothetical protein [Salinigranum sp. GCM10025319]|uniref:hypothetical protein n=1 Tax=Salinigranum sp. GCM10025319 TaxID=3252687 RepID=UPI00360C4F39
MTGERFRRAGGFVVRYGVVYPGVVAGGAFLAAGVVGPTFGTVLFVAFAVTAVATGVGAMNGSSSNDPRRFGGSVAGTSDPGGRWEASLLAKLVLFDLGLAAALTIHAAWAGVW